MTATPEEKPIPKMFVGRRRGAEYNTGKGLDWARIRAEYEAAATQQELVHEAAAAKAIQRGATLAEAKAAGREAVAKAFPPETDPAA